MTEKPTEKETPGSGSKLDPAELTVGQLLSSLKTSQAWKVGTGLVGLVVGTFFFGYWLGALDLDSARSRGGADAATTAEADAPIASGQEEQLDGTQEPEEAESPQLVALRETHGVSKVRGAEEQLPYEEVPPGRYGYCLFSIRASGEISCRVLREHMYTFPEVHRATDGTWNLVLFASEERALSVRQGRRGRGTFYRRPQDDGPVLVSLPFDRLVSFRAREAGMPAFPRQQMFDIEYQEAR